MWYAEWSSPARAHGSSVHVLAYGADPASPGLATEMALVRDGRLGRLAGVLAKLAALGVPVSEAEVMAQVGNSPSVGRPHIADALIKAGMYAIGRRRSTDSSPTVVQPTCPATRSRWNVESSWCTRPGASP